MVNRCCGPTAPAIAQAVTVGPTDGPIATDLAKMRVRAATGKNPVATVRRHVLAVIVLSVTRDLVAATGRGRRRKVLSMAAASTGSIGAAWNAPPPIAVMQVSARVAAAGPISAPVVAGGVRMSAVAEVVVRMSVAEAGVAAEADEAAAVAAERS